MKFLLKVCLNRPVILFFIILILPFSAFSQGLENRLNTKVDQLPSSKEPPEQLIEVAKHYKIPMGVEWVEPIKRETTIGQKILSTNKAQTVRDLIKRIVNQLPDYRVTFSNSLVYIAQKRVVSDEKNFLNIRIAEINFSDITLGEARGRLTRQIRMLMHPERYAQGYNGGYGSGFEKEGEERKITLKLRNATIRDILNNLVALHGNSMWVVRLATTKEMKGIKYYEQGSLNSDQRVTDDFYWQLINLSVY